jgi:deoxycytidylate deaminase
MGNSKLVYYCEEAKKEAIKSGLHRRHGAVVVHKKRIIARGYNKYILNCQHKRRLSIHAEMDAISNMPPNITYSECTIVVVRIDRFVNADDGNRYFDIFRYSHPCVNCAPVLNKLNFQKIVYSTDECEFIPELKKFKMKELTVVKKVKV